MSPNVEISARPVWLVAEETGAQLFANVAAEEFLVANQLGSLPELFDVCGGLSTLLADVSASGIFSTEVGDGVFCVAFEIDNGVLLLTIQPRAVKVESQGMNALLMLGKFGGKLGHDFNNILGSIQGCVELVRSKVNSGAPKEAYERPFKILDSALAKSVQLTDKIRGFVRAEPGQCPLKDSVTNALGICVKIDPSFTVEVKAQPPSCQIGIAAQQFEQLLVALLMNAHEAAAGSASLEFSTNGEMMEIVISDKGSGFSEEQLAGNLQPFFSSKSAGVGKGYGLGLVMAKEILKQAGGELKIRNLNPGAEVRVVTPVLV